MSNVRGCGQRVHCPRHERGPGVLVRQEKGKHSKTAMRGKYLKFFWDSPEVSLPYQVGTIRLLDLLSYAHSYFLSFLIHKFPYICG